jgi:3-isopropylmalate dehydrogenase
MFKIALIPGDGIGKEVISSGLWVLDAISEVTDFKYETSEYDIGADRYLRTGELVTEGEFDSLAKHDAIYFGAIGDPRVKPGILEKGVLIAMRTRFDQYINLRPVKSWHPYVPLKRKVDFDIDFLRENTEDFYMGAGGFLTEGDMKEMLKIKRALYSLNIEIQAFSYPQDDFAFEMGIMSRKGIERFADFSFAHAKKRGEEKVTLVDKANVCNHLYGMMRDIFTAKAKDQGIELEFMFVDAMTMAMITRPETFGTVAVPNMFGDILTDLGAQLQGGLGMAASGNINPNGVSMFEPVHGSAPDIAGQGKANPFGAILAAKMMLDHLGRPELGKLLEDGVQHALDLKKVTPDLGGSSNTAEVTQIIVEFIKRS